MGKQFEQRLEKGKLLYDELIKFFDDNKIEYLKSGYEHLIGSNNAAKLIRKLNDKTSLFVRHYPDITFVGNNKSMLIEVKNSTGIERECYETYLSISNENEVVVLLMLKNKKLCKVQDIVFSKPNGFDYVANINIPVVDDIWRTPRSLSEDEYLQYLKAYQAAKKYTSGCAFAFIDFDKTPFQDLTILKKYSFL